MKNLIILLSFIFLNIGSYAQTNVIVKSITKKVTKESSEKILKKTAKEASEEIGEKSIKKSQKAQQILFRKGLFVKLQ